MHGQSSGIEGWGRALVVEGPLAEFVDAVVHRVVQGLRAQVAPVAVETQRGVGGAGAGDFEQAVADVQAVAAGGDLGGADGHFDLVVITYYLMWNCGVELENNPDPSHFFVVCTRKLCIRSGTLHF